jgi:integrase
VKLIWRESSGTYVVRWKEGGRWHERSAKTREHREALRFLGRLEKEQESRSVKAAPAMVATWQDLLDKLATLHYPTLKWRSERSYDTALTAFARICKPVLLRDIDTAMLLEFRKGLLQEVAKATVANYVRHVRSALSFAKTIGLLQAVPEFPRNKRGEGGSKMKGFAITRDEFRQWLRSEKAPRVRALLILLWVSGLRLGEAISLRWESKSAKANVVDLTPPDARANRYPHIFFADQKSGHSEIWEMPALMYRWLRREPDKTGRVWKENIDWPDHAGKLIKISSRSSGIRRRGKFPTSHDIRRSFGTRHAMTMPAQALKRLMRHADLTTTLIYYADAEIATIGPLLYRSNSPKKSPKPRGEKD